MGAVAIVLVIYCFPQRYCKYGGLVEFGSINIFLDKAKIFPEPAIGSPLSASTMIPEAEVSWTCAIERKNGKNIKAKERMTVFAIRGLIILTIYSIFDRKVSQYDLLKLFQIGLKLV